MTIALNIYNNQSIAVMGLGRSGLATITALIDGGAKIFAWDDNKNSRDIASKLGANICDLSNPDIIKSMQALILSPGIAHNHPAPHPVAKAAKDAGVKIIGDIELLYQQIPNANYIGITGTNGKSTTTALIGHILKDTGYITEIGGNLGFPVLDLAPLDQEGSYVLEMSSYQLELLATQKFNIALLLNITNDHLERHGGIDGYIAAKMNIFARQNKNDTAIISIDDDRTSGICQALSHKPARVIAISTKHVMDGGVYLKDNHIIDDLDDKCKDVFNMSFATTLPGLHNAQNAIAAYTACRVIGLKPKDIIDAISDFKGLAHRQQIIAIIDNIAFVNDSKATNAEATTRALGCYKNIYWIAGGIEKNSDYSNITPFFKNINHGFLIGKSAKDMAKNLNIKANEKTINSLDLTISGDLKTAINQAFAMAISDGKKGSVILLSPACASFDQFKNFETRGDQFIKQIHMLSGKNRKFFTEDAA